MALSAHQIDRQLRPRIDGFETVMGLLSTWSSARLEGAAVGLCGVRSPMAEELERCVATVRAFAGPLDLAEEPDASLEAIVMFHALHHLSDEREAGYPAHRAVLAACARTLRASGLLIVATCAHEQLRRSYGYLSLAPDALTGLKRRYVHIETLGALASECGLAPVARVVPLHAGRPGEPGLDELAEGDFVERDPTWTTALGTELARALSAARAKPDRKALTGLVSSCDAARASVGRVTMLGWLRGDGSVPTGPNGRR